MALYIGRNPSVLVKGLMTHVVLEHHDSETIYRSYEGDMGPRADARITVDKHNSAPVSISFREKE